RRNLLREGRPQATGTLIRDAAIEKVLERTASLLEWEKPLEQGSGPVRRGRGIALGFKACIANTTSLAAVQINADGSCTVYISTVDRKSTRLNSSHSQISYAVFCLKKKKKKKNEHNNKTNHHKTNIRTYHYL